MNMGITLNTVKGSSIRFGQPRPCPNFCSLGLHFTAEGKDKFYLNQYPQNVSPSGGASCVISESEMIAMKIDIYGEVDDRGIASLWREGEKLTSGEVLPDSAGYHTYDVIFYGAFDGEIDRQGYYTIFVSYPSLGDIMFEFEVL